MASGRHLVRARSNAPLASSLEPATILHRPTTDSIVLETASSRATRRLAREHRLTVSRPLSIELAICLCSKALSSSDLLRVDWFLHIVRFCEHALSCVF